MMDWYFGHEGGDLVVPKDQEYFDRLPSPDSWSQWGTRELGNLGWSNNFDTEKVVNLPDEKPHHRILLGRGNNGISQRQGECSFGSTSQGVSSEESLRKNSASCGRPEYHLNNLMEDDPMDDIFLSSLLQDDFSTAAHNHNPLGLAPQSADSDSTNMILEYQSISSDTDGVGYSRGFRTPPFSPSAPSDDICYGNFSGKSNQSSEKVLETMDMLPSDSRECGDEDSSIEESVLVGLEAVLCQMNNKTRLCFRDSLYRLAQRSEQQFSDEAQVEEDLSLDSSSMLGTEDRQMRSTTTTTTTGSAESETNTIDRAVANLMFNKASTNIYDHLPVMSAKFEHMDRTLADGCNYGSNLPNDSEVPVFRQCNPLNTSSQQSSDAEDLF